MKVCYVVNNYSLGAKVKTTPTDRIAEQEIVGKNHTLIVYDFLNQKQKEFCDKVLAKKGQIVE